MGNSSEKSIGTPGVLHPRPVDWWILIGPINDVTFRDVEGTAAYLHDLLKPFHVSIVDSDGDPVDFDTERPTTPGQRSG